MVFALVCSMTEQRGFLTGSSTAIITQPVVFVQTKRLIAALKGHISLGQINKFLRQANVTLELSR